MLKISNLNLSQGPNLNLRQGPVFGNIKKNKPKENNFWSTKKVLLIFKDCFPLNFFWKTTLFHNKLNKKS